MQVSLTADYVAVAGQASVGLIGRTVVWAAATGGLAGACFGSVDAVAAALSGRCVPTLFLTLLLAAYLVTGMVIGGVAGILASYTSRGRSSDGNLSGRQDVTMGLIWSACIAVAAGIFVERIQCNVRDLLGREVHYTSALAACVVFAGACAFSARFGRRGFGTRDFAWRIGFIALLCGLWGGLNRLYDGPRFGATSLLFNGAYFLVALGSYFGLNRATRLPRGEGTIDTVYSRMRAAAAISVVGWVAAVVALWLVSPGPITRASSVAPLPSVSPRVSPSVDDHPNVILIVMDTVRADHLSVYGYERNTSPALAEFSRTALCYTLAMSTSSWTLPSHASIFTGLMPSEHGSGYRWDHERDRVRIRPLSEAYTTLAEALADNGYRTGGILSNHVPLREVLGVAQGFQYYNSLPRVDLDTARPRALAPSLWFATLVQKFTGQMRLGYEFRDATVINELALDWLDESSDRPFFLFLNYADPHEPYRAHPEFDAQLGIAPREDRPAMDRYDSEIAYLDAQLGLLFSELKRRDVFDSALIIVTSDHGEAFGEHGHTGHLNSVYQEEVHVPLIVRYPGGTRSGLVGTPVSNKNIYDWVLDAAGVDRDELSRPSSEIGGTFPVAEIYRAETVSDSAQQWVTRAIYSFDGLKFIDTTLEAAPTELFDLISDPAERFDLARSRPDAFHTMGTHLSAWVEQAKALASMHDQETGVAPELSDQLRSLGYLD